MDATAVIRCFLQNRSRINEVQALPTVESVRERRDGKIAVVFRLQETADIQAAFDFFICDGTPTKDVNVFVSVVEDRDSFITLVPPLAVEAAAKLGCQMLVSATVVFADDDA